MIKEEAIVKIVRIKKPGDMKYFQVQLPEDTRRIIGIETSSNYLPAPPSDFQSPFAPMLIGYMIELPFLYLFNPKLGDLYLYTMGMEHVFYSETIQEQSYGQIFGDVPARSLFVEHQETVLATKREELSIEVKKGTGTLEGWFRDIRIPEQVELGKESFDLKIYLWVEKCIL